MKKSKLNVVEEIYLTPEISSFDTLDKLINSWTENPAIKLIPERQPTFPEINETDFSFIIGEPGYGKSTLLKKLSESSGNDTVLIDCKELRKYSNDEISQKLRKKHHAYFDGLDEVSPTDFLWALDIIQYFRKTYKTLKVTIACRSHYVNRYHVEISKIEGTIFYEIGHFDTRQVRIFLNHHINNSKVVELIMNRTINSDGLFVLRTPRYLEAFVRAINDEKLNEQEIETLERTDIFEKVMYHKLKHDMAKALK